MHQFTSSEHHQTLFFVSKFQFLCKFGQVETFVSGFGFAFCVQAVAVADTVGGEVWRLFPSARPELNTVAGRQRSDRIREEHKSICHPARCAADKKGLCLVGAEHILYHLIIILIVAFTNTFPEIYLFFVFVVSSGG